MQAQMGMSAEFSRRSRERQVDAMETAIEPQVLLRDSSADNITLLGDIEIAVW